MLVLLLGMLFAGTSIALNQFFIQRYLTDAQSEWVKTLTYAIAEGVSLDTIDGNVLDARDQLIAILKLDEALEYAYITDFNGKLFVHTFEQGFPRYLMNQISQSPLAEELTDKQFVTEDGEITETSIVLIEGMRARLHVGVNQNKITSLIQKTKVDIFAISVFITLLGIGVAALLGRRISAPLEQLSTWMSLYGKGKSQDELVLKSADAEVRDLVSSFNTMIEDRAHLEVELKESETFNRMLFESLPLGLSLNRLNGEFVDVNPAFCKIVGRSMEEIKNLDYWDITPKKYTGAEEEQLQNLNLTGHYGPYEKEYIHADGHSVPVRLYGRLIKRNGKDFIWSIVEDITSRKLQDEQLRRSQKMDALGKLTGGISHDYNNMLGVILGYAEMLEVALEDQPRLAGYVGEIYRAGVRGSNLTKKLLTFSRMQSSESKALNLNDLLNRSRLMLEKTLTARISLEFDLEEDLWLVCLDEGDLEDAILNISINAMHAIEGNGSLDFQTRNEVISEVDAQQLQIDPGNYVLFSITDSGVGMDQEVKDKIFDPFYTTKGDFGTGLGLSQVYGFVHRSQGVIRVYSEVGHGTRFSIYFPRYSESGKEENGFSEEKLTELNGSETILIVDDEPALTDLTSQLLNKRGYRTLIANSGQAALDILESEKVDLLLSDVIMPDMDGYQLAEIVEEKYPHIKIQLASGFSDNRHVNAENQSLHENVLDKPYHSNALLLRVRELLNES